MPCPTPPGPRPSFITAAETARSVLRYSCFGQTVENVFYFTIAGGWDAASLLALNLAIDTAWTANIKPHLSTDITLVSVVSTDQGATGGAQDVHLVGVAGSSPTAGFESLGNTLALKFGTGLSGRSNRGRTYWPQLLATVVSNNEVVTSFANDIVDATRDFFDSIASDVGCVHVVASYMNDCEWRLAAVTNPVTSYSYTDTRLDSQRRRLSGRGI